MFLCLLDGTMLSAYMNAVVVVSLVCKAAKGTLTAVGSSPSE